LVPASGLQYCHPHKYYALIMKQASRLSLVLAALAVRVTLGQAHVAKRGETPGMPYDASTIAGCTYWYDNDGGISCRAMLSTFSITREQFEYWVCIPDLSPRVAARDVPN
jgi:hypothetical protein